MAKIRTSKTTLERRGRLFFGLFILLTVAACLWWPWWQMERLVGSGDQDRAQALVRAYVQNRHAIRFAADPKAAVMDDVAAGNYGRAAMFALSAAWPAVFAR